MLSPKRGPLIVAKVKFTLISIRDAEVSEDSRLFVLNRSNPSANVNFNITDSAGQRQVITVPVTSAPVDLANFAEKTSVLRDPTFRRLVAKGLFKLVDPDQAQKFIETDPRGISETKRIYEVIEEGNDPILGAEANIDDSHARSLSEKLGAGSENPFVENIVGRSKGDEDAADLISEIDGKLHTLTLADLEYISKHAGNAEIKTYAAEQLEEMKLEEETRPEGQ
ncbi:hypothetical protein O152_gp154 [Pseudomonas phage PaBG]|uniref:hypothetical protein n=1 Tax=Pseudomonas phage PaBG TaxID=1335230 RepID=UPI00155F3913|nr:hypothetical protein O152_gp154 [Pseudomonas phage PaBG]AGS82037.2 hypothetical protein PaBG_00154 [Pseudomonas phage PaBG]